MHDTNDGGGAPPPPPPLPPPDDLMDLVTVRAPIGTRRPSHPMRCAGVHGDRAFAWCARGPCICMGTVHLHGVQGDRAFAWCARGPCICMVCKGTVHLHGCQSHANALPAPAVVGVMGGWCDDT
eukprot:365731-Chlamydomonas_euryale.AAC.1